VSILIELREKQQEVVSSTINPVDIFAWSALVPPYQSTAGAKATTTCRIVAFDCVQLRPYFESDYQFAYLMTQRAAQGFRERLNDMRIESLAYVAE
jgi:CRP-like cAMP-binding protein